MKDRSKYETKTQRCQRRDGDGSIKCFVPASRQINGIWTCGNHEQDKPIQRQREMFSMAELDDPSLIVGPE